MNSTKRKRVAGSLLLLLALTLTAFAVWVFGRLPGEPLRVGAPAPRIEAAPLNGAVPLPQSRRRVLFFFSPSCSHCRSTLAQLEALRVRHPEWFAGERSLSWAFISVAGREETDAFAGDGRWPTYHDESRAALKSMGGLALPYVVLVDEGGLVRHAHKGEFARNDLEELLGPFYAGAGAAAARPEGVAPSAISPAAERSER